MTTDDTDAGGDLARRAAANLDRMNLNIARMEELSQRLVSALGQGRQVPHSLQGPSQEVFVKAAGAYVAEAIANPAKVMEHQAAYWGAIMKHYVEAQQVLGSGRLAAPADPTPKDRRFANPLWDTHPWFNFIKQNYLLTAQAVDRAIADLDGLDAREKKRVDYFTRQILDLYAPTNYLATNPDALEKAVETEGQSLVDGLENLVRDIEANQGDLVVTLADRKAFTVGENLATTPGSVVFRNRLFELIQYAPTTEKVHETPLVIFPPWINKFYILDLKAQNSLIKWIVDQGFTLFVVSWVNPDPSYRDIGLEDYIREGYLEAIAQVKALAKVERVNAVGYCIAGTTLSLTLAWMSKRKDTSVKAATLFTTLTDFSDQGEVGVFLDDDFLDGIEREVEAHGILDSFYMSRTFSYLRSNDLIYAPAIRSYMMGQAPPAFDLLYWNGDGTNLPAKMAVEYLRGLCQQDRFATTGFPVLGETVHPRDIRHPVFAVACETDHIAAWASSYAGVRKFGSRSKTFVLSQSGHIAGIVNPPSKKKYGHYTNGDMMAEAPGWREAAEFHEGSWWPRWGAWLARQSGKQVPAREPGDAEHPVLGPAPGTYVAAARAG